MFERPEYGWSELRRTQQPPVHHGRLSITWEIQQEAVNWTTATTAVSPRYWRVSTQSPSSKSATWQLICSAGISPLPSSDRINVSTTYPQPYAASSDKAHQSRSQLQRARGRRGYVLQDGPMRTVCGELAGRVGAETDRLRGETAKLLIESEVLGVAGPRACTLPGRVGLLSRRGEVSCLFVEACWWRRFSVRYRCWVRPRGRPGHRATGVRAAVRAA